MKIYLVTTGAIFGLMAAVHVWRTIAEWPHSAPSLSFLLSMGALVVIPAVLAAWAFGLLRKLPGA